MKGLTNARTAPVHLLLLIVMGLMWGLQFAMLKLAAADGFGEIEILTISLAVLAVVFLATIAFRRELFRSKSGHLVYFSVGSFLGYILPLGLAIYVSRHLTAGLIALTGSLVPLMAIAIAAALRTEQISLKRVYAMLLGTAAALLIFWPEFFSAESRLLGWIMLCLIIPFSYALDGIYIGAFWPPELGAIQVVAGEAAVAAVMLLPFYLLAGEPVSFTRPWTTGHKAVFWFTFCGFFEVLLFFYLIRHAGAVLVSFGSLISLFAGIGWGILIFSEQHGPLLWIAVGLMSASLIIVALDKKELPDG